jgi:hypothetical protein
MDCINFDFADNLLNQLENELNQLNLTNEALTEIYAHMIHTQGVMIDSLLRNPNEKILLQIERMQILTTRVKCMLPDATAM